MKTQTIITPIRTILSTLALIAVGIVQLILAYVFLLKVPLSEWTTLLASISTICAILLLIRPKLTLWDILLFILLALEAGLSIYGEKYLPNIWDTLAIIWFFIIVTWIPLVLRGLIQTLRSF